MGWKSIKDISREEAIELILKAQNSIDFNSMSNGELENILYGYGYGDDINLPHYGYNFSVFYKDDE